jgi:hypothetical protein
LASTAGSRSTISAGRPPVGARVISSAVMSSGRSKPRSSGAVAAAAAAVYAGSIRDRSSQPRRRIGTAAARIPVPSWADSTERSVADPSSVMTSQSPMGRNTVDAASRWPAIAPIRSR